MANLLKLFVFLAICLILVKASEEAPEQIDAIEPVEAEGPEELEDSLIRNPRWLWKKKHHGHKGHGKGHGHGHGHGHGKGHGKH